ncbi:MAG: hypothetical protein K8R02_04655 [Anaerohalosphaeraceae bacterium]|nr:hypothetical protein [Anaerohalosphaeraceae bacterium]
MALTGRQKAAILLMSLDATTAAELLKDVDSKTVQEIVVEASYLDANGLRNSPGSTEVTKQFCNSLEGKGGFHLQGFLSNVLNSSVGQEKAEEIQMQIGNLLQKKDPFMAVRAAGSKELVWALQDEHPQAVAVVLSELPAKKATEVLGMLDEGLRLSAVTRMAGTDTAGDEAKTRIAQVVCNKLESAGENETAGQEQSLRKVAVMLRGLSGEIRDGLLKNINEKDDQAGQMITNLMVIWDDIPQIVDRTLQEVLKDVDSQKLALALVKADEVITKKIKSNISERAAASVDEETGLMSSPVKSDIEDAKAEIVDKLKEMNEKGQLNFIED